MSVHGNSKIQNASIVSILHTLKNIHINTHTHKQTQKHTNTETHAVAQVLRKCYTLTHTPYTHITHTHNRYTTPQTYTHTHNENEDLKSTIANETAQKGADETEKYSEKETNVREENRNTLKANTSQTPGCSGKTGERRFT